MPGERFHLDDPDVLRNQDPLSDDRSGNARAACDLRQGREHLIEATHASFRIEPRPDPEQRRPATIFDAEVGEKRPQVIGDVATAGAYTSAGQGSGPQECICPVGECSAARAPGLVLEHHEVVRGNDLRRKGRRAEPDVIQIDQSRPRWHCALQGPPDVDDREAFDEDHVCELAVASDARGQRWTQADRTSAPRSRASAAVDRQTGADQRFLPGLERFATADMRRPRF